MKLAFGGQSRSDDRLDGAFDVRDGACGSQRAHERFVNVRGFGLHGLESEVGAEVVTPGEVAPRFWQIVEEPVSAMVRAGAGLRSAVEHLPNPIATMPFNCGVERRARLSELVRDSVQQSLAEAVDIEQRAAVVQFEEFRGVLSVAQRMEPGIDEQALPQV